MNDPVRIYGDVGVLKRVAISPVPEVRIHIGFGTVDKGDPVTAKGQKVMNRFSAI